MTSKPALERQLGRVDLTAIGIGAVIGVGIFLGVGYAAGVAGPAVTLSFAIAAVVVALSAMSYAELASALPLAGGAYSYALVLLGRLAGWLVGWSLLLLWAVAVGGVAVAWGANLNAGLQALADVSLPAAASGGGSVNVAAVVACALVTALVAAGVRLSASAIAVMVAVKLAVLALFAAVAGVAFDPARFSPFAPYGLEGVLQGAGIAFFAYLGFDAAASGAEESRHPQRDVPLALLTAVGTAFLIYAAVAAAAVGAASLDVLASSGTPLVAALHQVTSARWPAVLVAFGALAAITSVMLAGLYAVSRILFSIARDGLLPPGVARIHPRTHTPLAATLVLGVLISLVAGVAPLEQIIDLVNAGALAITTLVNIAVVVLRRRRPQQVAAFRAPLVPWLPALAIVIAVLIAVELPAQAWIRFAGWLLVGGVVFALVGQRAVEAEHAPG